MPQKFTYILNEKLNIHDRQIYCKVTGQPGSAQDDQPYVLVESGGPGFGHELTELYIKSLIPLAAKENASLPHFIFYDHLGCGQSDKAVDDNKEYTVDHFTDLAAELVTAIKNKFHLTHMNLYVEGGSFGSLVAMNFPARKPEWLDPQSAIQLKQVTSKVGPKGSGMAQYTFDFLQEHYSGHPNFEKIFNAQKKLFSGEIKNQADYVQNFVLPMASLYVKDVNKSRFNQALQRLIAHFPHTTIKVLDWTNRFFKTLGIEIESLNFADIMLGKCSIDVLNHFFKTNFNGFNILETVKQNKASYEQIPIGLISASEDHVVDYKIAEDINRELPHSSAAIIFKEPHMLSKGPSKKIYDQLNYDLLVQGRIPAADVSDPVIISHTVSEEFNKRLAAAHTNQADARQESSTAILMTAMPEQIKSGRTDLNDYNQGEELADQQPSPNLIFFRPVEKRLNLPEIPSTLVLKPNY